MPQVNMASLAKEVGDVRKALEIHLAECAILRKESIDAQLETKDALKALAKGAFAVLVAIVGWLVVQLWNGRNDTPAAQTHAQSGAVRAP